MLFSFCTMLQCNNSTVNHLMFVRRRFEHKLCHIMNSDLNCCAPNLTRLPFFSTVSRVVYTNRVYYLINFDDVQLNLCVCKPH